MLHAASRHWGGLADGGSRPNLYSPSPTLPEAAVPAQAATGGAAQELALGPNNTEAAEEVAAAATPAALGG